MGGPYITTVFKECEVIFSSCFLIKISVRDIPFQHNTDQNIKKTSFVQIPEQIYRTKLIPFAEKNDKNKSTNKRITNKHQIQMNKKGMTDG